MKKYRIATIQGDGIGQEVVPEGIRVMTRRSGKPAVNWSGNNSPGVVPTTKKPAE